MLRRNYQRWPYHPGIVIGYLTFAAIVLIGQVTTWNSAHRLDPFYLIGYLIGALGYTGLGSLVTIPFAALVICARNAIARRLRPTSITEHNARVYVSSVSLWEIGMKTSVSKLKLSMNELESNLIASRVVPLVLTWSHAIRAYDIAPYHRDPFDRLLLAQAVVEPLHLLTTDESLGRYSSWSSSCEQRCATGAAGALTLTGIDPTCSPEPTHSRRPICLDVTTCLVFDPFDLLAQQGYLYCLVLKDEAPA
jgi:PIN domain nuclease of toxin-antitoxin system